jgi:hypothetical protein
LDFEKMNQGAAFLTLQDFPMDERLNNRTQEFLGDDIHHLRAHLFEHALDDRLDQGRIWRFKRSRIGWRRFGTPLGSRRFQCGRDGRWLSD